MDPGDPTIRGEPVAPVAPGNSFKAVVGLRLLSGELHADIQRVRAQDVHGEDAASFDHLVGEELLRHAHEEKLRLHADAHKRAGGETEAPLTTVTPLANRAIASRNAPGSAAIRVAPPGPAVGGIAHSRDESRGRAGSKLSRPTLRR